MNHNIKIINKKHPHYGEAGTIVVNISGNVVIKTIGKTEMFEVNLINCEHGFKSCFVSKDDIELVN